MATSAENAWETSGKQTWKTTDTSTSEREEGKRQTAPAEVDYRPSRHNQKNVWQNKKHRDKRRGKKDQKIRNTPTEAGDQTPGGSRSSSLQKGDQTPSNCQAIAPSSVSRVVRKARENLHEDPAKFAVVINRLMDTKSAI